MNYSDMFAMLGSSNDPYDGQFDSSQQQFSAFPTAPLGFDQSYQPAPAPMSWEEAFSGFKSRPVLYNMDGWISPFASSNWGGTSNILAYIDEQYRLPGNENKLDPNRIFTAEVNGLRALSADQAKILKLFERKLMESLTEKGKIGLTEEDIEAMSTITAARSALTNIEKEKVAIKKNIADIKIKQSAQGTSANNGGANANQQSGRQPTTTDIGMNILDNIFAASGMSASMNPIPSTPVEYSTNGVEAGVAVIDGLFGSTPNSTIAAERAGLHPVAIVGDTGTVEEILIVDKDNNVVKSPVGIDCPTLESVQEVHLDTNRVDIGQEQSIDIIDRGLLKED